MNLASASLVLIGGILTGPWRLGLWTAALLVQAVTPFVTRIGSFTIGPAHFVERTAGRDHRAG
jgi:low temperature requirement protein LtrA